MPVPLVSGNLTAEGQERRRPQALNLPGVDLHRSILIAWSRSPGTDSCPRALSLGPPVSACAPWRWAQLVSPPPSPVADTPGPLVSACLHAPVMLALRSNPAH